MIRVVGVRFKAAGKVYYFDPADSPITTGDKVVVETARGVEYGEVAVGPKEVTEDEVVQPLKRVLRVGTDRDAVVAAENRRKEREAFGTAQKKIEGHGLEMNLVDVEYTFDGSKVIFYFTAEGRIDFRELVRDLASVFRTRIEMRQIGVRDEAKMLGGLGPCGRILCCTSFLGDFAPVSIRMAKDQNLSLNPTKISGLCGRLMCCLRYEQDTYEAAKKDPTLAPGYVPPVVPADEPLPELTRLEDPPAQKVSARRAALGGISARIAQAAGLDEPLGQPEPRTGERRGERQNAGSNRPQAPLGRKERSPRPDGQTPAGQPQERRDAQSKGRRQGKPQTAGERPQPARPQGEKPVAAKGQGNEKQAQLRQLPGEKLRGARVAPEQEQQEVTPQEKQSGKHRRRSRRSRPRGQDSAPHAEETAITKAPPERAPRPERPQSERSSERREASGRQQSGQPAQDGAQTKAPSERHQGENPQGERPQGSRPHRRNRRGRRRSGGGDRSGAGESGGNPGGGQTGGQPAQS